MLELIVGTYGVLCWLVLVKFKLVAINVYTIFTAMAGGVVILVVLYVCLSVFHPVSHDGRMYAPVVQIVPEVRGTVIEVPVVANQPLKKGDVLFRIEPRPFQIEVDRLRAALAGKNSKFAQLTEQLAAAEAATRQARANLLVSESKYDRQLRETYETAKAEVVQSKDRVTLADSQVIRVKELLAKNAIAESEYERVVTNQRTLKSDLVQAEAG